MATIGKALISTVSIVVAGTWFAACGSGSGDDLSNPASTGESSGASGAGGGNGVGGAGVGGVSAGGHAGAGHAGNGAAGSAGVAGAGLGGAAGHGGEKAGASGAGVGGGVGHGGMGTGGGSSGSSGAAGANAGHAGSPGGAAGVGGGTGGAHVGGSAGASGANGGTTGGKGGEAAGGAAAGQGGVAGAAGTSGAGGAACTGCDDGIACTTDACTMNGCTHTVDSSLCQSGQICDPVKGCVAQTICSSDATCIAALGSDACKVDIHCNKATAVCAYSTLDSDGDGFPPIVCGGTDCDDSDPNVHPGAPEICDGKDDNCNGIIDENATCPGAGMCENGACVCAPSSTCNGACVDITTDPDNCGVCGNVCPAAATCHASNCECPGGAIDCNGACVDTNTDPANCTGCGLKCPSGYVCDGTGCACLMTSCSGACVDITSDPAHCGGCNTACPGNATCQASECVCDGSLSYCGASGCVDETVDPANCGGCGKVCPSGVCKGSVCQTCPVTDILLFQDLTGSMLTDPIDPTVAGSPLKANAAHDALKEFIVETALTGMDVGIGYFPAVSHTPTACTLDVNCMIPGVTCCAGTCCNPGDCASNGFGGFACDNPASGAGTASCTPSDYPSTSVAPALMPGNETLLGTSIDARVVTTGTGGGTSPQSVQGELAYAEQWLSGHPGHKVVVVVLSDGLPNDCTTSSDLSTSWLPFVTADEASIKTYFVEIGNGSDCGCNTSYPAEYMKLSTAAGTTYFTPRLSTVDIKTALDTIVGQVKCN